MNNNLIYCVIGLVIIWYVFFRSPSKESFKESNKSCPLADYQEELDDFGVATAHSHLQERANRIKKAVANCEKLEECPLKDMQQQVWNFHNQSGAHASSPSVVTGVDTGLGYASPDSI